MTNAEVFYVVLHISQGNSVVKSTHEDFLETKRAVDKINSCEVSRSYGVTAEWREVKRGDVL